ncbi:hypothetical protein HYU14_06100 [Candidatus Woesearchaeota archaeon]|nr:hypothetical protein [Candidatus Woesearchaeota archaeon]
MAGKKKARKAPRKTPRKAKRGKKEKRIIAPKIDLSKLTRCPECGSDNIYYSQIRDEIICRDCGGIFSELTPEQMKKFSEVSKVI